MTLERSVRLFKSISIWEGISFLVLLLFAMPLKYFLDLPQAVRIVGMAHGVLFIAYVFGALALFKPMKWSLKELFIITFASVVPLGPFYVEKKYLK